MLIFFKNEVDYLGHIVSTGNQSVSFKTTQEVQKFKLPITQVQFKYSLDDVTCIDAFCLNLVAVRHLYMFYQLGETSASTIIN